MTNVIVLDDERRKRGLPPTVHEFFSLSEDAMKAFLQWVQPYAMLLFAFGVVLWITAKGSGM